MREKWIQLWPPPGTPVPLKSCWSDDIVNDTKQREFPQSLEWTLRRGGTRTGPRTKGKGQMRFRPGAAAQDQRFDRDQSLVLQHFFNYFCCKLHEPAAKTNKTTPPRVWLLFYSNRYCFSPVSWRYRAPLHCIDLIKVHVTGIKMNDWIDKICALKIVNTVIW